MSNDLISRNDVLLILEKVFKEYRISWGKSSGGFAAAVPNAIENIHTAYDIDKVIEQLENKAANETEFFTDDYRDDYYRGAYAAYCEAIEIVKGGVE